MNLEINKGNTFSRWTVIKEENRHIRPSGGIVRMFKCKCECGKIKNVELGNLRSGISKSCGCINKENVTTHGLTYSSEYKIWSGIIQRCTNYNFYKYRLYGGRGITVCDRWNKFINFYNDMGKRPSKNHSIDRIDGEKGYCKDNCRWATYKQQNNNSRRNHYIKYNNKIYTLSELSKKTGIKYYTLKSRINNSKWSVEKAVETPINLKGIKL